MHYFNLDFLDPEGTISSFNFDSEESHQYMQGLKYSVCFKRPNNACEVPSFPFLGLIIKRNENEVSLNIDEFKFCRFNIEEPET